MRRPLLLAIAALALACLWLAPAAQATFPGANGQIYYTTGHPPTGTLDVFSINPNGGAPTELTDSPGWNFTSANAVSPDGKQVAFGSGRDTVVCDPFAGDQAGLYDRDYEPYCPDKQYDAYIMNADGTGQTNLTNTPNWNEGGVSWLLPDGARLLFNRSFPHKASSCWTMNPDGSDKLQLSSCPGSVNYSPDGTKVLYEANGDGGLYDVYIANSDGTNPVNITHTPDVDEADGVTWSPDGQTVVYVRTRDDLGLEDYDIFTHPANTTDPGDATDLNPTPSDQETGPIFSPDGTKIAYALDSGNFDPGHPENSSRIGVVNADGSHAHTLVNMPHLGGGATEVTGLNWAPIPPQDVANVAADPGDTVSTIPNPDSQDQLGTDAAIPAGGTGGQVSVQDVATNIPGPNGYDVAPEQAQVAAPTQTASDPLSLTFTLDASMLPSASAKAKRATSPPMMVFKKDILVANCTQTSPTITPDPCLASRGKLANGDLRLRVLSTRGGRWNFGTADHTPPQTALLNHPAALTKAHVDFFKYGINDAGFYKCKLDGDPLLQCPTRTMRIGLNGSHVLSVRAVDDAGNVDSTPVTFNFKVTR